MAPHAGSWFGLPDFGITEGIGNVIAGLQGVQPTYSPQGGSQLIASPYSSADQQQIQSAVSGSSYSPVLGSSTSSGSNNTSGTNNNYNVNDPQPAAPSEPAGPSYEQLINDVYSPTVDYLNQAQSTLGSNYSSIQGDINAQYGSSKQALESERSRGEAGIGEQEQKAGNVKDDAMNAATRLFQELQLGGQQRFGRASGIGQAFQELGNRELMQNQGNIQQDYSEAIGQANRAREDLQARFTTAIQDLETQKNTALNDARRSYDDKLLEITRLRSSTESEKAAAKLDALQQLRNQVFAINMQDMQFKQQLAVQKQASEQSLASYTQNMLSNLQNTSQAVNAFQGGQDLNPQTALLNGGRQSGQAPLAYTGRVSDDDELVGSVNPLRREDIYA